MKNTTSNTYQAYQSYSLQYNQQQHKHYQQQQNHLQSNQQQLQYYNNQQQQQQQWQQLHQPTTNTNQQEKVLQLQQSQSHNLTNTTSSAGISFIAPVTLPTNSTKMLTTKTNLTQNQYNFNTSNFGHFKLPNFNKTPNNVNNDINRLQQQQHFQLPQQQVQLPPISPNYLSLQQLPKLNETSRDALTMATAAKTAEITHVADKLTMDATEIANFLASELFMQQLASMDSSVGGVPTLTTPTLTPTTMRSIEQTLNELTNEPINAPYQAGFIPPPLDSFASTSNSVVGNALGNNIGIPDYADMNDSGSEDSQLSWNPQNLHEDNSMATTDTSSAATDSASYQNGLNSLATSNASSTNDFTSVNIAIAAAAAAKNAGLLTNSTPKNSATGTTRRQGGRRPAKSANMTPEEEEKRRIRRERNKLAAARCRKRRVDQTNELLEEVHGLESKGDELRQKIENLNEEKQRLEYLLETHRPTCQKMQQDIINVGAFSGLIVPTSTVNNVNVNPNANRVNSPIDIKPNIFQEEMLQLVRMKVKSEPLDPTSLDSNSLDNEGPPSPKRMLLSSNNPMIPPPLPHVSTINDTLAAVSASLNTPIVTTAPVSFSNFANSNATLNALNANTKPTNGNKQRPNSLPVARHLMLGVDGKPITDINGIAIQTPSVGTFNFESLMAGGTGLTPVTGLTPMSNPLVPTCSSQNKHPLELVTPTSEPSKLVSL